VAAIAADATTVESDTEIDVDAGVPVVEPLPLEDVDTVPAGVGKLLILPFALVAVAAIRVRRRQ
jgi:hypothetical protein